MSFYKGAYKFNYTENEAIENVIANNITYFGLLKNMKKNMLITDVYNNSLLHMATKCGHVDLVRFLLNCGVYDLDQKNKFGETVMDIAIKERHYSIVKVLNDFEMRKIREQLKTAEETNKRILSEIDTINQDFDKCKKDKRKLEQENCDILYINKKLRSDIMTYQELLKNKK